MCLHLQKLFTFTLWLLSVKKILAVINATGSSPGKPDFFRLSFRNCISCVNNCEDLLYIYFIPVYMLYKVVLSFESVDKLPGCDHSRESF